MRVEIKKRFTLFGTTFDLFHSSPRHINCVCFWVFLPSCGQKSLNRRPLRGRKKDLASWKCFWFWCACSDHNCWLKWRTAHPLFGWSGQSSAHKEHYHKTYHKPLTTWRFLLEHRNPPERKTQCCTKLHAATARTLDKTLHVHWKPTTLAVCDH